ncbi:hypothetical protein QJS66_09195 [Kocuria rhizophila]|nr:hypothetical protein QJS66_09195 [Kocuria rhizophila]
MAANEHFVAGAGRGRVRDRTTPRSSASDYAAGVLARCGLVKSFEIQPNDSAAVLGADMDEGPAGNPCTPRPQRRAPRHPRGCEVAQVPLTEETCAPCTPSWTPWPGPRAREPALLYRVLPGVLDELRRTRPGHLSSPTRSGKPYRGCLRDHVRLQGNVQDGAPSPAAAVRGTPTWCRGARSRT